MIQIIKSAQRFHRQEGWLNTRWHFSFDDYFDPQNMGWGNLRVFNDDVVAPGGKFGMHPHANFEIITIVLDGAIVHEDSAGHKGTTGADEVQVMTAGRGVYHSEANEGKKPLHLLQIWIASNRKGLEPAWKQHSFSTKDFENHLCAMVSGVAETSAPLPIHQDATLYRARLSKNKSLTHAQAGAYSYLFVISGELTLNGHALAVGDSAKIKDEKKLEFSTASSCDFLLIELP